MTQYQRRLPELTTIQKQQFNIHLLGTQPISDHLKLPLLNSLDSILIENTGTELMDAYSLFISSYTDCLLLSPNCKISRTNRNQINTNLCSKHHTLYKSKISIIYHDIQDYAFDLLQINNVSDRPPHTLFIQNNNILIINILQLISNIIKLRTIISFECNITQDQGHQAYIEKLSQLYYYLLTNYYTHNNKQIKTLNDNNDILTNKIVEKDNQIKTLTKDKEKVQTQNEDLINQNDKLIEQNDNRNSKIENLIKQNKQITLERDNLIENLRKQEQEQKEKEQKEKEQKEQKEKEQKEKQEQKEQEQKEKEQEQKEKEQEQKEQEQKEKEQEQKEQKSRKKRKLTKKQFNTKPCDGENKWLAQQLKEFCRELQLPVSGSKDELCQRLNNYFKS